MLKNTYKAHIAFKDIEIGQRFLFGGTEYFKRSSRTAHEMGYHQWFYFSKDEIAEKAYIKGYITKW